jgi:Sulfatase
MIHSLKSSAHLAGLWAIAVALPILLLLAAAPEFFVAHDANRADIVIVTGVLTFAAPLVFTLLICLATLVGRRASDILTALAAGTLAALVAIQAAYRIGVGTWLGATVVVAVVAAAVAAGWLTVPTVRTFLTVLSGAMVVVPLLFLTSSGIRPLVAPKRARIVTTTAARPIPVVLIVFDELSLVALLDERSQIDPDRYPHLAALARDGIWFRNATAVSDYTQWALPPIVTGRYPRPDTVPTATSHPQSLFTLLAVTHRLEVVETMTRICPPALCHAAIKSRADRLLGIARDLRVLAQYVFLPPAAREALPDLTQAWAGFHGGDSVTSDATETPSGEQAGLRRLTEARDFIKGISSSDSQPTLYFLHTLTTHQPTQWLPSGQVIADRRNPPGRMKDGSWGPAAWPVVQHFQGHLLQAGLADTLVGELVARLNRVGLYDRALVVVTADHGASFRPGSHMRAFSATTAADLMPVPLIVKLPATVPRPDSRLQTSIDDRNVETIDVLPTIADVLDVELPWTVDGMSALTSSRARREKRMYSARARRVRVYLPDELATERQAALDRQIALFGTDVWPATRVPGFEGIVDAPVDSRRIEAEPAGLRVRLLRPFAFEDVDADAAAIPAQVRGWVEPADRVANTPAVIAIALNGRIVATTQTAPGRAEFSAIMPPSRLTDGPNRLEAFLLRADRRDQLFGVRTRPVPPDANVVLPQASAWGVEQRGLRRPEKGSASSFRWTDGRAVIDVPIEPHHAPSSLDIAIAFSGPAGKRMTVRVDGCTLVSEPLMPGAWSRTMTLGQCEPKGYWARVEIQSDTHKPRRDNRRLGVALQRVTLR